MEAKVHVDSELNIKGFRSLLKNYHDVEICDYLDYGWPINHNRSLPLFSAKKNHSGVNLYNTEIDDYLLKELKRGSAIGPFGEKPFSTDIAISPLNAIPKKDSKEPRIILDLSYPMGYAINDDIPTDSYLGMATRTTYPTVDDLVILVHKLGRGCLLYKKDLKKAYRQIPIDP